MTTIPLSRVVFYLRRKGVGIECLEGAPVIVPRNDFRDWEVCKYPDSDHYRQAVLYLGSGSICPAAMGWAVVVLGVARQTPIHGLILDGDYLYGLVHPHTGAPIVWLAPTTKPSPSSDDRIPDINGDRLPVSDVARLRAVLEYEMERP